MRRARLSTLVIAAVSLLVGCTTDDPRKGGLFGGLVGLGGGAYRERLADEQQALEGDEARYRERVEEGERIERTLASRRIDAERLELDIASLQQETDDLDAEITALQREATVAENDVDQAEANVAALLDDIDRIEAESRAREQARALGADAGPDADPAEFGEPPREQVSDLRAYINKLQDAVDALKAAREKRAGGSAPPPRSDVD